MNNQPKWLPPLVMFTDYDGDWEQYLAAIYSYFSDDFLNTPPVFRGQPLKLKRHPISQGKEATFWHMVSEGKNEEEREIDFRRCERIRWLRPVIDHSTDHAIKVWKNTRRSKRGPETRVCLWLEAHEYLVILAERNGYLLPWTAYVVERSHQKRKLQNEYEAYLRRNQA